MAPVKRPQCYGTLFPDLHNLQPAVPQCGKVFTGSMHKLYGLGPSIAQMEFDPEQWDQCTACEHYRTCYDLSAAKLMLATGLRIRT